ncbi:MAG TPA: hypothetical protein VGQ81_02225, partial [Acidobacteriota bacterium]|nr:hypothetical protein [Acidobacteriota bacterium]
ILPEKPTILSFPDMVDSPQPPPEAAGSDRIPHVAIRYSHPGGIRQQYSLLLENESENGRPCSENLTMISIYAIQW